MFRYILFTLLDNAMLYDWPFNVCSNIYTGVYAPDDQP